MRASFDVLVLLVASSTAAAATPTAELVTPPAAAQHFAIMSSAGKHGTSARWTTAGGRHMGCETLVLRGQVFELDSTAQSGRDGRLNRVVIRGFTPNGDAAEEFAIENGIATRKSPVDAGSAAYHAPAEYTAFGGPFDLSADLSEALLAAPDRTFSLLPGGFSGQPRDVFGG